MEEKIINSRVPKIHQDLQRQLVTFVQNLRNLDLKKLPSVSETIDWARALVLLNVKVLEPEIVRETLNILLKFQSDIDTSDPEIDSIIEIAKK